MCFAWSEKGNNEAFQTHAKIARNDYYLLFCLNIQQQQQPPFYGHYMNQPVLAGTSS